MAGNSTLRQNKSSEHPMAGLEVKTDNLKGASTSEFNYLQSPNYVENTRPVVLKEISPERMMAQEEREVLGEDLYREQRLMGQ